MREMHTFYGKTNNWVLEALYEADRFLINYYTGGTIHMSLVPELKGVKVEVRHE